MAWTKDLIGLTSDNIEKINSIPEVCYSDYSSVPNLTLTATPAMVQSWSEKIVPVGMSELNGRFTMGVDGVVKVVLERIYENDDQNPADVVILRIEVRKNGVVIFDREAPISSATSPSEPAIATFVTPSLQSVVAGDYFEVFVSGTDNGADPQDVRLIRAKIVANMIAKLP